jgi:SAM-dependent methyltransferase
MLDLTAAPEARHLLLRWFLIREPVPAETAEHVIPNEVLSVLIDTGLLTRDAGAYEARHLLLPCGEFYVASDHQARFADESDDDHVIHVNPASRFVYNAMIPMHVADTYDLGTGCGILALHAAAFSDRVLATDINPRAIEFASFNAVLNGIENIDFVVGDGFRPAAGSEFQRIVCNPPFILAPGNEFAYRDNDMELDMFCRELAREAPQFLSENGYFQMIVEWVEFEGQTWEQAISDWFTGLPCDVWVVKEYSEDPSSYTQMRLRETLYQSDTRDAEMYDEWMSYYRERRVARIHGGLITMRRRSGEVWRRIEALPEPTRGPFGADLANGFAVADFMEQQTSDESLLATKLQLSPDARLQQNYQPADGDWQPTMLTMLLETGLKRSVSLDGPVAQFVAGLEGEQTLGEVIARFAEMAGADLQQAQTECLPVIRTLLWQGMVLTRHDGH